MASMDVESFVRTQTESFDAIMAAAETNAISTVDLAGMKGALTSWIKDGYRVGLAAWSWSALPFSREEKSQMLAMAVEAGWLPVFDGLAGTEYRIVKVVTGRGWLGGDKVSYRVYEMTAQGHFVFASEHRSINMAAWALQKRFAA